MPAVLPDKLCGVLTDSLNMIPQGRAQENKRKTSVPGERERWIFHQQALVVPQHFFSRRPAHSWADVQRRSKLQLAWTLLPSQPLAARTLAATLASENSFPAKSVERRFAQTPFFSRVAQPRSRPEMEEGFSFDRPSVFALTLMKDSPGSTQGTGPKNSWRQFCWSLSLIFYDVLCMKISHLARKPKQPLFENKSSLFCVVCVKVPLKRGIAISD